MSKPIYKAQERPYNEDLNDLIEKGGVGSGKRGHTTAPKPTSNQVAAKTPDSAVVAPEARTKSHENIDKQIGFAYDMNSQTSRMNQFKTALRGASSDPALIRYAEANIRRAAKTLKLTDQVEKLFKDAASKRAEMAKD